MGLLPIRNSDLFVPDACDMMNISAFKSGSLTSLLKLCKSKVVTVVSAHNYNFTLDIYSILQAVLSQTTCILKISSQKT